MTTLSTTVSAPTHDIGRARRIGLLVVAVAIAALFGLPGVPSLLSAWSNADLGGAHRIHLLAEGAHGLIILIAALALVRARWRTPAAVQLLLVALVPAMAVAAAVGMLPGVAAVAPVIVALAGVVALAPARRELLAFRPSGVLLGIALVGAAALTAFAVESLRLQAVLPHVEPHAAAHHWAGMGIFAVTLAGLAVVAALRARGWRLLLWVAGATAAGWGLVSLAYPTHPSSLGLRWGTVAVLAAATFLVVGERTRRAALPC